jgi:threonine-phosphate decarboxylase
MIKKHGGNVHAFAKEMNMSIDQIVDFSANINPLGVSSKIKSEYETLFF